MPIKVGFVLSSSANNPLPSTRIAVLNVLPLLRASGFDTRIVFEPPQPSNIPDVSGLGPRLIAEGFQIVCFQKVFGPGVTALVRELSAAGIKTVSMVCDVVEVEMATATHATIVVTDYLRSLYPRDLQSKMHVVHDGIEHPEYSKLDWGESSGPSSRRKLRAVLVTSSKLTRLPVLRTPPAWLEIVVVGDYPERIDGLQRLRWMWWAAAGESRWTNLSASLAFMRSEGIRLVPWHPVHVYDEMLNADVGIIPIECTPESAPGMDPPAWRLKSENRLTLKMGIGLPVVATPIPSYECVVEHGRNGFLASTKDDWLRSLDALRDPQLRREIGQSARATVAERYSLEEQARRLLRILRSLLGDIQSGTETAG
jgi:hypothetical protein